MPNYNSDSIVALENLDPVRVRPGMYTKTHNPNHLAQEVIDNCVDEALGGHATQIDVKITKDGYITITDDGRGMPVDIHPVKGVPGVQVIMETLHAGGKFDSDSYGFSGGLHGVGISVVNALSEDLRLFVKRDGNLYFLQYKDGYRQQEMTKVRGETFPKKETGTTISFKPNPKYFDDPNFNKKEIKDLLKGKAILCSGLKVNYIDETKDESLTFFYEDGLNAFLSEQEDYHEAIGEILFSHQATNDDKKMEVSWACYWTEGKSHLKEAYVNLIPTIEGGTHVNAMRTGILEGIKEYATLHNLFPKNIKLSADDIWKNTQFVISLKMREASFASQTKERLSSRECAPFIMTQVRDSLSVLLNNNIEQAELLISLVLKNASARLRSSVKVTRKSIGKAMALPGKLTDCETDIREDAELFIVEGDSAGGSAKQARNRETQAIMPLRGKILNSWEADTPTIMKSEEINNIATAIGVDPHSDDLSNLRYGKIAILADADSDGLHIAVLFIALFQKHFPAVIDAGHVFVSMPPLFRIDVGKQVFYALDEAERASVLKTIERKKIKGEVNVQRFKGLGEMNPSQLRETTLDPDTRRLVRLDNANLDDVNETFDMLLSKKRADDRKAWLEENGNKTSIEL